MNNAKWGAPGTEPGEAGGPGWEGFARVGALDQGNAVMRKTSPLTWRSAYKRQDRTEVYPDASGTRAEGRGWVGGRKKT